MAYREMRGQLREEGAASLSRSGGDYAERPAVPQLHGVATRARSIGAFFSRSEYTREALRWAEAAGVAAFMLTADGKLAAQTNAARRLLSKA